jgi:hypothetical protein
MSTPKLLVGSMVLLVLGEFAWAGGFLASCRPVFRRGHFCRIIPRTIRSEDRYPCPEQYEASLWLRWKFEVNRPFYQTMKTKTTQDMAVLGQKITQMQDVTYFLGFTPLEQDEDGNWKLKQRIEGLKMEIEIGGNKIQFDSSKKGADGNPLSDFYKALVGSEFILTIDKNMKISKIEGRDQFLKKLLKGNQQLAPLLQTMISDDALKQMSEPAIQCTSG